MDEKEEMNEKEEKTIDPNVRSVILLGVGVAAIITAALKMVIEDGNQK